MLQYKLVLVKLSAAGAPQSLVCRDFVGALLVLISGLNRHLRLLLDILRSIFRTGLWMLTKSSSDEWWQRWLEK